MFYRIAVVLLLLWVSPAAFCKQPSPACEQEAVLFKDRQTTLDRLTKLFYEVRLKELDQEFSCLDHSTRRFPSGHSGSSVVYQAFRNFFPAPGATEGQRVVLNIWKREVPGSIYVEFADLRHHYAFSWTQRGGCSARCTPEDQMQAFAKGLAETEDLLQKASSQLKQTTMWNHLLLATVLDSPLSKTDPVALFMEDVERWPQHYDFYELMVLRLVPKWGGSWRTVDDFIQRYGASLTSEEGESFYARLYANLVVRGEIPQQTMLAWPRMKRSLDELVKRYPDPAYRNLAASFACAYRDRAYFRFAMTRVSADELQASAWIADTNPKACVEWSQAAQ